MTGSPEASTLDSERRTSSRQRLVVYTGDLSFTVRKGIVEIDDALSGLDWLIIECKAPRTLRKLWKSQVMNVRRHGWRWLTYQLGNVATRLIRRRGPAATLSDAPGFRYGLASLKARANVEIRRVEDIHSAETLARVRDFGPTLGLSLAAPILRRSLFSLPQLGTINLHKGKLPDFRGMPPAFWELWTDQASVGCSVHAVDDHLDTGPLLAQSTVARQRFSTVRGLQLTLDEVGVDLMLATTKALLAGEASPMQQPSGGGHTYRKPTLAQERELTRRLAVNGHEPALKTVIKRTGAMAQSIVDGWGLRRLLAPRLVVLLYHRVADDARDNLTVGVEQFDQQMAWVASHCKVVSIEQVLAMQQIPAPDDRPLVAITFDDGYLDNYVHGAKILMRHGLPAAFFVSTGIVNSDHDFPHDVRRGNPSLPKMTWAQLAQMRDWGFTIGSHTVHHIDCAGEPEDLVRQELAQSMQDLKSHLGVVEPILAYPYGGRHHMTPERLELVKAAGYAGCLSAYGGVNVGHIDRFNVLRQSISWEFDLWSFRRVCMGWA